MSGTVGSLQHGTLPCTLADALSDFRRWLFEDALPFWAHVGLDVPALGFREHLTLDGAPAEISYKRLRVQARQIYVFSHAALLGWPGGVDVARRGYDFIKREGAQKNGAWARTLGRNGGVIEDIADL